MVDSRAALARVIGGGFMLEIRACVGHRDLRVRNGRLGRVCHPACDGGICRLRPKGAGIQKQRDSQHGKEGFEHRTDLERSGSGVIVPLQSRFCNHLRVIFFAATCKSDIRRANGQGH